MEALLVKQRNFFLKNNTKDYEFRRNALDKLEKIIIENEDLIALALSKDLKKDISESYFTEIHTVLEEIKFYKNNLKKFMKKKKMKFNFSTFSSSGYTTFEPKGVTLIVAPWNYPFYLSMVPFINNIGAGNTTILKLSNRSTNTSKLIEHLLNELFESDYVFVLDTTKNNYEAIELDVDHIFFTGSTSVGKVVMETASKKLIPVTLELGGKSPCIVTEKADLKKAVKEILWGKLLNSGQTCIAPDHVFVHKNLYEDFLEEIKQQLPKFSYENRGYIDDKHLAASQKLLEYNEVVFEEKIGTSNFYVILGQYGLIQNTEIFSMILPLILYNDVRDVLKNIKYPLATYIFSKDRNEQNYLINNIVCRGFTINGTISHITNNSLPFGGIRTSGMGSYHGYSGFCELSYTKSVLNKGWFFPSFLFPPYHYKSLKRILRLARFK